MACNAQSEQVLTEPDSELGTIMGNDWILVGGKQNLSGQTLDCFRSFFVLLLVLNVKLWFFNTTKTIIFRFMA